MIRRLYVHNFRCLENFELKLGDQPSVLLIGDNGTGKSTIGHALEILRKIAQGENRVDSLVKPKDLAHKDVPVRFEIEAELKGKVYQYVLALELPLDFRELRVLDERLSSNGQSVYTRSLAQVQIVRTGGESVREAAFRMDWHMVAFPIIQEQSKTDPLFIFRNWLSRILILRPAPGLITGDSDGETMTPNTQLTNLGDWFSGVLGPVPKAYITIEEYLKRIMPDLKEIRNEVMGKDAKSLFIQFSNDKGEVSIHFGDLSDGEKCFVICALVLAANQAYGPLVCYWDEPDSYLALSEVSQFVMDLRRAFQSGGQFIATSHNPEAIRRFSNENTLLLHRRNHLEPAILRSLDDLHIEGDLVGALLRGDVEP